ncbi:GNAT family N-acetyltransferase [Streptomyces sp. NBC_00257]|uniref:GNAT family N-acetyltransferase n=1 Tax=Streptomyces TaxID=1883 RepID=UPI001A94B88D|nr:MULTISPECIES: GNAT family N-acetyltransferase [Streptomyces]MBO0915504.1 GNAT family N-acetyltransferase [Streptomyces laculatispora]MCX4398730.1 GNAT family N-acetyltransferase [Streptomyces sp. NBC_01767]MCX4768169.1 GNAT family N-acetyltransferase [Streptomyces sp. NBC_01285]MCX4870955.1 GNAT family N-acetyltransferase [Streptomyces sp. NBC_00906]MCX4901694.1 GNAT family N-acetyltransferase [Streptomyces sp. NBC_00892]
MPQHQSAPSVRPITDADVPTAVDTLARAFADYPFTRHVIAADGHEERIRRYQELCLTRIGMVYGRVWVADEGRAVAVWAVPGQDPSPAFAELGPLLGELSGDRAAASETADTAMAPYRPEEPGWFLETVATAPEAQGKRLGSTVLIPGIQEAERAGYPAFLETSSEANVRFYERLGFKVTADVQLPDNGPRTWCMRRDPR